MRPLLLFFAVVPWLAAQSPDLVEMAEKLYRAGEYAEAGKVLQPLLEHSAGKDPYDDSVRYAALKMMYQIEYAQQAFDAAEPFLQEAINYREVKFGAEHPALAEDLTELANLLIRRKDYDRAALLMGRVMAIHRKDPGPRSAAIADDWARMAQIYLAKGEFSQAMWALRSALEIREELHGVDHVNVLPILDQLGDALTKETRYEEAEPFFRRALLIRERLFGPHEPDVLPSLEGLAYSCFGQKKYEAAELLYQRILSIWKTSAGPDHPMVALTLDKLAAFYRDQKREADARAAVEQATAVREQFLANGLSREAGVQLGIGDKQAAGALYERALAVLTCKTKECQELRAEVQAQSAMLGTKPPSRRVPRAVKAANPTRR